MRKKKALWITITIAAILLVMGAIVIAKPSQAKVLPEGISFNGNSLAGLTPDEAKEKITEYMSYYNSRTIELTIGEETKTITMEDIEFTIAGEDEALTELEEAIPYGNVFQRYKQEKDLEQEPVDIKVSVSYNEEALNNLIAPLASKYEVAVAEPTYQKTSTGFVTTSGANGVDYDEVKILEDLKVALEEAIPSSGESGFIQYTAEATVTTPNVEVGAYDKLVANVLGTYTTKFDSGNVDRTYNLEVACQRLNGLVIFPKQEVSLLGVLGPYYDGSYREAGTILNGQNDVDTAGGICQVATTLYDALLNAEIEIVYRASHSLVSNYVPYSFDAMIHPSGADFKFRNNLDVPIYIEAGIARTGSESPITITVYGKEYRAANRKVEYYNKTLSEQFIPPVFTVERTSVAVAESRETENIPARLTRVISNPSPKVSAQLWKKVTVDGVVVEDSKVNDSNYKGNVGSISAAWDVTIVYWAARNEFGSIYMTHAIKDGRTWDHTDSNIDFSNAKIIEWVGQGLNEDGSVKQPETTAPEETTPEETTPAETTTAAPETTPAATTTAAPETTPAATTTAAPETTPAATTTAAPETTPAATTTAAPETTPAATTTAAPETTPAEVTSAVNESV